MSPTATTTAVKYFYCIINPAPRWESQPYSPLRFRAINKFNGLDSGNTERGQPNNALDALSIIIIIDNYMRI